MLEASSFRKAASKADSGVFRRRPFKLEERELEVGQGDESLLERSSDSDDREKDTDENKKDQSIGNI